MSTFQRGEILNKIFCERKNFQLQWNKKWMRDNAEELKVWKEWMTDTGLPYTAVIVDDRYLELKLNRRKEAIAIIIQNSCYCSFKCRKNDDEISKPENDRKRKDLISNYNSCYKMEKLSCRTDRFSCNCGPREPKEQRCKACPQGHYGLEAMLKFFVKVGCSTIRLYFNQNASQMRSIFTEEPEESDESEELDKSEASDESEEWKELLDQPKHLKNLRKFKTVFTYYCGHGSCEGYNDANRVFFDYRTISSRLMFDVDPTSKKAMHVPGNRVEKIFSFHQSCQVRIPKIDPKKKPNLVPLKPDDHDKHFRRYNLRFAMKIREDTPTYPSKRMKMSKESALKKCTFGSIAPASEGEETASFPASKNQPAEWGCTHYIPVIPGCVEKMFEDDENFDNLVKDETTFMEFCKKLSEKVNQLRYKEIMDRRIAEGDEQKMPEFAYSIRSFAIHPNRSQDDDQENTAKVSINMEVLDPNGEPLIVFKHNLENLELQKAIGKIDATIQGNDDTVSDVDCNELKKQSMVVHDSDFSGKDFEYSIDQHFKGMKNDDFFKLFFKN